MKVKQLILIRIPLFIKLNYFEIFKDLIINYKKNKISNEINNKTFLFDSKNFEPKKKTSKFSSNYAWFKILKNLKIKKNYNEFILNNMQFKYLTFLAKYFHQKIVTIAYQTNKKIDYIADYYIRLCENEIKRKYYNINEVIDDEEEEEKGKKQMMNLFIGKFDAKNFFKNHQMVQFTNGSFINAFIFRNKEGQVEQLNSENNNSNNENISYYKKYKFRKKDYNSSTNLKTSFRHYKNNSDLNSENINFKKNNNNFHINAIKIRNITGIENSMTDFTTNKTKIDKNKINQILSLKKNSFRINNKLNKFNNTEEINKEINNYKIYLPNIFKTFSDKNIKLKKDKKNCILNFLNKKDLYY